MRRMCEQRNWVKRAEEGHGAQYIGKVVKYHAPGILVVVPHKLKHRRGQVWAKGLTGVSVPTHLQPP